MPAQRILIIKHGALGDVVLAMGTMKRLRELHPEAHITLMTMGMFVPMAEQLGVFDDFYRGQPPALPEAGRHLGSRPFHSEGEF